MTQTIQKEDYYPFGLTFNSYSRESSVPNQYKFNGIEEQDELGLNVSQALFRTMDPAIGRWWQIDPKVDGYFQVSPYNMMGNNPVNFTDFLGDEWADPKKDGKIAAQISKGLDKANASLAKQNASLDKRIAKAEAKGNTDKVNRLSEQKAANTVAIGINNTTKDHLTYMASKGDNVPKFTFGTATGNVGGTDVVGDKIVMSVTTTLGNRAHEVSHGWDRSPVGIHSDEESRETRAYQAQYSSDASSMPHSDAPGTISSPCSINGVYVGGVYDVKPDGSRVMENGKTKREYKDTFKKYRNSYPKE